MFESMLDDIFDDEIDVDSHIEDEFDIDSCDALDCDSLLEIDDVSPYSSEYSDYGHSSPIKDWMIAGSLAEELASEMKNELDVWR